MDGFKKMIIYNTSDLGDGEALTLVHKVIEMGRVSYLGRMYCAHSEFEGGYHVATDQTATGADTFRIYKETRRM